MAALNLTKQLLMWYDRNRRILPWREDPTPYHVWVSEIMLQQTRVEAVREYYDRFLHYLPDIRALAEADPDFLLKLWQGLGYYSRARHLQEAARIVCEQYGGALPQTAEALQKLPGIGLYTAGAISSIAFGKPEIAPDGNAYRIFARLTRDEGFIEDGNTKKRLESTMREALDQKRPGAFNQALMDLGSLICLAHGKPLCEQCPLFSECEAGQNDVAEAYPHRRPKKSRRLEEKTVLLLESNGQVLLKRQPAKGLLAGMWLFPMLEGKKSPEAVTAALREHGFSNFVASDLQPLGSAKHIFSHIEWHMTGYRLVLDGKAEVASKMPEPWCVFESDKDYDAAAFAWAAPEEIAERYAIPSAHQMYLIES